MPNLTEKQSLAVNKSNTNIIVSAGAGSGKTAVLTERVIQKLKNGESVDKLLILTFTNAAAKEMKDRIRHAIISNNLISELDKIDSVTKAHIANDIINNEKNRDLLIKNFNCIPNKGEFIETIMNENCPAYVKKETVTPKSAAEIIRDANGKVVLAHPVAYVHEDNFSDEDILNIINDMKPDGLEANYLYVDRNSNKINEVEKWNNFAKENNLFVTAGSDFHNKDGLRPEIGFVNTEFALEDDIIDEIIMNLIK